MSTICKLDPTVRRERHARRDTVHALFTQARSLISAGEVALSARLTALAMRLESIRLSPRLSGAQKAQLFRRTLTTETVNG